MAERGESDGGLLNVANAHLAAGRAAAAVETFVAYARRRPERPEGWTGIGIVNLRLNDTARARAFLEKALSVAPDDSVAFTHYIELLRNLGEFERAKALLRAAIAERPDYAEAYFGLSVIEKFTGDAELTAIEAQLADTRISAGKRAFFHFAAGKIADDLGDCERAFRHYRAGNEARGVVHDFGRERQRFDRISGVFSRTLLAQPPVRPRLGERFVFIVGMPRSGSTLLETMLARHSQVAGTGERGFIEGVVAADLPKWNLSGGYPEALAGLPPERFDVIGADIAESIAKLAKTDGAIVNKHLINFQHVGFIRKILPAATIVHMRRHPLDICLSCYFQNFRSGHDYSFDLTALGRYYRSYADYLDHWAEAAPGSVVDVAYDDLVADPAGVLTPLLARLGLVWEDGCLDSGNEGRSVETASSFQVRQAIHGQSVGKWLRYRDHLNVLEASLREEIADYERSRCFGAGA